MQICMGKSPGTQAWTQRCQEIVLHFLCCCCLWCYCCSSCHLGSFKAEADAGLFFKKWPVQLKIIKWSQLPDDGLKTGRAPLSVCVYWTKKDGFDPQQTNDEDEISDDELKPGKKKHRALSHGCKSDAWTPRQQLQAILCRRDCLELLKWHSARGAQLSAIQEISPSLPQRKK